jgi:predicted dienelactone hydrolase
MGIELIQQPLDITFALNEVATNPPEGLGRMFDFDHAGAIGYSFDGYNALALSRVRVDPRFYLGLCKDPVQTIQNSSYWFDGSYHCPPAQGWDQYVAAAGERAEQGQDGL